MSNGSGISRGDRNHNARLGRLRGLVRVTSATRSTAGKTSALSLLRLSPKVHWLTVPRMVASLATITTYTWTSRARRSRILFGRKAHPISP